MKKRKQGSLKRIPEVLIVKMRNGAPEEVFADSAFGKKTMDMRIPFEVTAESMKDTDKAGSDRVRFGEFLEHT